jgi:hypothetical protein
MTARLHVVCRRRNSNLLLSRCMSARRRRHPKPAERACFSGASVYRPLAAL